VGWLRTRRSAVRVSPGAPENQRLDSDHRRNLSIQRSNLSGQMGGFDLLATAPTTRPIAAFKPSDS